ncbi:MAG: hypothetical protein ACREUA_03285 [Burkholderiales bacterium]
MEYRMENRDNGKKVSNGSPYGTFPHITNTSRDKSCYHGKPQDRPRAKKFFNLKKPLDTE